MRKVVVITGQTATGKTKYALNLAKKIGGELVSADSRQIYKHLDIITGKDIKKTKIWLYDVADPKETFSSFDYKNLAQLVISKINAQNKIPIIVGGTYLYIKHLLYGIETEGVKADWDLRKKLNKKSVEELSQLLKKIDVKSFQLLNPSDQKNPRRLIRKIELALYFHTEGASTNPHRGWSQFDFKILDFIGLRFKTKEKLAATIGQRVEERFKMGAVDEVKNLLKMGYKKTDPGLNTIGYKQIIEYLEGIISKDEAIKKWVSSEIQYARRQYTFMKKDKNIRWCDV